MAGPLSRKKKSGGLKWLVCGIVAAFGIYYGFIHHAAGDKAVQQQAGPPGTPVSVASVVNKRIVNWKEFSGILQAVHSVEIRPRVSGQIMNVYFKDGADVKKGEPLFTIDPRPYEAVVISTKGTLAQAEAMEERSRKLVKTKAISSAEFETTESAYQRALGDYKAASVNLDYTRITAPISGRISRAELTEGNLVDAGPNAPLLASIVTVSPIYAAFDVDEQTFLNTIQGVTATKLKTIPVEVALGDQQNGKAEYTAATIHSFDNQLAPGNGTIRVRALLENRDATLIPGLYARVRLGGADPTDAILINPTAIGTDQSKKFVFVQGEGDKAEYREVTLGGMVDGLQVITSGLEPNEKVVVNGLQRVRPGAKLEAKEVDMTTLKGAGDDTAPAPADASTPGGQDAPDAAKSERK